MYKEGDDMHISTKADWDRLINDFIKLIKDAPMQREEVREKTWEELAEYYRHSPEFKKFDESMGYFPELVAKTVKDCLQGHKGWLMIGCTGCGKTYRAQLIARYAGIKMLKASDMYFEMASKKQLTKELLLNGAGLGSVHFSGRAREFDLIIDDLGQEPPTANIYGSKHDLMLEMLTVRQDYFPKVTTYYTTNLPLKELEDRYGKRFISRIHEQNAIINFAKIDHRMTDNQSSLPGFV